MFLPKLRRVGLHSRVSLSMLKLCDSVVTVVVRFDGLCVLPINMINDKIYIALWFWLFLLLIISSLHLVFRCLTTHS